MFNALNRFISRLDSDSPAQSSSNGGFGFQVLRNKNAELTIEPWFDFIIGINDHMIEDSDPALFAQEIRNCAGITATIDLWSAKGQRTRWLRYQVPSSGDLGLTLQYTALSTVSTIWHILDVPASSPADIAGLLPYSDYILGTPEGILHGESGLEELVEDHIGRPLRLYVYNNEYDVTREVTIHPSRDWGGAGALGCVLGFGALHRLPPPLSEPVAGPGETLFSTDHEAENARFSNEDVRSSSRNAAERSFVPAPTSHEPAEFVVLAQMVTPPPPPGGPPPSAKKDRRHGHGAGHGKVAKGDKLMDDYFKEGEIKSKEVDFAPSAKNTPPPPPPKSKGPPPAKTEGGAAAPAKTGDDAGEQSGVD